MKSSSVEINRFYLGKGDSHLLVVFINNNDLILHQGSALVQLDDSTIMQIYDDIKPFNLKVFFKELLEFSRTSHRNTPIVNRPPPPDIKRGGEYFLLCPI